MYDYQIHVCYGIPYLHITPNYTGSDGRYYAQLGKAALASGRFPVDGYTFTKDGKLKLQIARPSAGNIEWVEDEVRRVQQEVKAMMDELLRWQDIAEIVKESRKPQKEG
jgi:hypothetical protein